MSDLLVLDASAAVALVQLEPEAEEVRDLVGRHLGLSGAVVVPEVFWIEFTNVLVRRHRLPVDEVLSAIRDVDDLGVQTITSDRAMIVLGLDLMAIHGLSAYDAAYLAIVHAEGALLLTLDARLGRAAGRQSLLPFPRAVHETLVPYGSSSAEIVAAHGAYLAELRRQAEAGIVR